MSGENELKPCPFCGGDAESNTDLDMSSRVGCKTSDCIMNIEESGWYKTYASARDLWNRRATPPGTETVPEGTSETLHRVFSDLKGLEIIDGEMIAAGVEPPTMKEMIEYVAKSLDAITAHRAAQKETPNAQG